MEDKSQRHWRAFEAALSHSPDFSYVFDLDGRFTYANRALLNLLQIRLEDAVGKNFFDLGYPHELAARLQLQIQAVIDSGKTLRDHTPFAGPGGELRHYEYIFAPVFSADGRIESVVGSTRDVTEQKLAEEEQQKSEERLKFALEAAGGVGTWDWDVARDLVYADARFAELFSVSPELAAKGAPVANFIGAVHSKDQDRVSGEINEALKCGAEFQSEYRVMQKDGSVRWVFARGKCHTDHSGKPTHFPGVVIDITERKQSEGSLLERMRIAALGAEVGAALTQLAVLAAALQRCAEAIVDHLEVAFARIWTLAPSDDILVLQASAGIYTHLDGPHGRVPVGSFKIGRIAQECRPHLTNDVVNDPLVSDQGWARKEGMVAFAGYPLLVEDRLVGVLALFSRKTLGQEVLETLASVATSIATLIERKSAEALLKESEAQFRTLAESIPHLAWMADETGGIFWYNRRWYDFTGTNIDGMRGWGWQSVHDPGMLPSVMEKWTGALNAGEPFEMIFPLRSAAGEFRTFLTRCEPLRDSRGHVSRWFGTNTDITDQRKTEKELRRMNRELEEFAYVASHDLQEPLRMVNVYTQLITRQIGSGDKQLNIYSGFVQRGVARMEALLQDLLSYSLNVHSEDQALSSANLNESLKDAISLVADTIEQLGATLNVQSLPIVRGDAGQLTHVFQNLLSNALKYRNKSAAPVIDIMAEPSSQQWVISVRDNGIGFEPEYAQKIFGLFKRLHKQEYEGTGLGLAICQRIVERHGGRMWAESKLGEGATFYFALLRADPL